MVLGEKRSANISANVATGSSGLPLSIKVNIALQKLSKDKHFPPFHLPMPFLPISCDQFMLILHAELLQLDVDAFYQVASDVPLFPQALKEVPIKQFTHSQPQIDKRGFHGGGVTDRKKSDDWALRCMSAKYSRCMCTCMREVRSSAWCSQATNLILQRYAVCET